MSYTAFHNLRQVSTGTAEELGGFLQGLPQGEVLVFDDDTGAQTDLAIDPGAGGKCLKTAAEPIELPADEPKGRGRPRLGVTAKEVTLLPRHWDWLNLQPGGASVVLRRLVEEARRTSGDRDRVRRAQESAYRFLSAVAGNLPGFEEATRALFAFDRRRFAALVAAWPDDVRDYAVRLAFADRA